MSLCQSPAPYDSRMLLYNSPVIATILRKQFIKKYYFVRPNMDKFIQLVTSNNKCILRKLALYQHHAFILRETLALDWCRLYNTYHPVLYVYLL